MAAYIALVISMFALSVSGLTFYFNFFRKVDDIRVIVHHPSVKYDSITKIMELRIPPEWTFINSGNRSALIFRVRIILADKLELANDPNKNETIPYEIEPFVIALGQILSKKFVLSNNEPPGSTVKKTLTKPYMTYLCASVFLVTPDNVTSNATIPIVGLGVANIDRAGLSVDILREGNEPLTLLRRRKPVWDVLRGR
jgi:hypothetical protein